MLIMGFYHFYHLQYLKLAKMEDSKINNLELWSKVEKTNPKYTKPAKVGGMNITSIAPQFQILNATEQFGPYGKNWGFKKIEFDYSITNTPIEINVMDWKTKITEKVSTILGLVGFKATFFFPDGEFEITNSIKIFTDNNHSKIDDNYAKKLETDALTKALSKLGFNADIFLGKFEDTRYLNDLKEEFKEVEKPKPIKIEAIIGMIEKETDKARLDTLKGSQVVTPFLKDKLFIDALKKQYDKLEPKLSTTDKANLDLLIVKINHAKNKEELTEIYNKETKFIENKEFMSALTNRRVSLEKLFKDQEKIEGNTPKESFIPTEFHKTEEGREKHRKENNQ